jgi:lysyl oxidase
MFRRLLPVVVALLLGVVAVAFSASGSQEPAPASQRLPDLDQEVPWNLEVTRDGGSGYRLGFSSAVRNVGTGPLIVSGRRRAATPTMKVDQLIEQDDVGLAVVEHVGRMRYVRSADHEHWHLLGFERYELRRAERRARPVTDSKTGFCLGDRYRARGAALPGEPREAVYTGRCGLRQTALRRITVGISVGYGDLYKPNLEGQSLSLTGLEAGRYVLVHRVNVGRRLRETSYGNNAASLLLGLRLGPGRPSIRVLRECRDRAMCDRPH